MVNNSQFYSTDRAIEPRCRMYRESGLWLIEVEVPSWVLDDMMGELKSTGGIEIETTNLEKVIRIRQKLPLLE